VFNAAKLLKAFAAIVTLVAALVPMSIELKAVHPAKLSTSIVVTADR